MRPLKSLTLEAMIKVLSAAFRGITDERDRQRIRYPVHDTLMSGFALMFFQHPSLLQFQRRMKQKWQRCNLETIFGVKEVPSDTQMREILDGVPVEPLRRVLGWLFQRVRRAGWTEPFKVQLPRGADQGSYYALVLDGSEYFRSSQIQCAGCLRQKDVNGIEPYSHKVASATVVRAGSHRVLPLDVEEVRHEVGQALQDCELTAAKRLIQRVRQDHRQLPLIVLGDDLYGHEPFVQLLAQLRCH